MTRSWIAALALTVALPLAVLPGAHAADAGAYPTKPVRIIVPFTPGGAADIMTRALGERLRQHLGQPVVIENKPGAGTVIASDYVARQAPDGYTLLMAASSLGIAPAVFKTVGYDPVKDFTPITLVASVVHVLEVNAKLPVTNVKELIDYLKTSGKSVSYSSAGSGTSTHLEAELFKTMAGVEMSHIPYKGSAPALNDLVAGNVQVMFDAYASSAPHIKSGSVRALAVTTAKRSATLPDLPTVAESGLPGYEAMPWLGLLAPAGAPPDVVKRVHAATQQALKDPALREQFRALGLDIIGNTPEQFAAFIKQDAQKWAKVAKASGAQAD
ncbi:tripartite tricarboxylate transporter substrate binding protein [Cupriavidus gilardii]|uniref:Bug family tripartite tricarboxylate transporter substrate binding protein n=1 Tax=Cupriavidus gilardii TaxID=82541 RepID=UPI001EE5FD4F|nr:tripartite tricarboxylate transporter substrate binding protein [Cupriavidus gilardii]MCG5258988.1 tripartite tricarboxylate transporter substrate binding protein [Cupriavidus gilardii]MDF9429150.1 tripartite tricarboxylate transporter substrate binding protein [Cupriavidus gilardii]